MAECKKERDRKTLSAYITDSLKVIAENTARIVGGNSIKKRYIDIVNPEVDEKPKETAEQTKNRLITKLKKDFEGVK